jgi:antitoxin CptB
MQEIRRRLLWRCRRGLLELDIVLSRFIETHYESLKPAEMEDFDRLLDCTDNDLLDLIHGRKACSHAGEASLLALMRKNRPVPETPSPD